MDVKKHTKLINNIVTGIMSILIFLIAFSISPNKIDLNEYSKAKEEYESNAEILKSKSENVDKKNMDIDSIKKDIDKLNNEIKKLKKENNLEDNSSSKNVAEETDKVSSVSVSEAKIHFINTGNSDAILIQGEKCVLIDGGDNDDENLVVNYIKKQGINKIDYMLATHPHADHIGGLDAVINNLQVDTLLVANGSTDTKTYKDFIKAAANKSLSPSVPLEGSKFQLGNGAYIQIFNTNGGSDTNEQSLITLYINGNDKALFMGDAESETENEVLDKMVDVNLLKVGHHGSKTSTTTNFLNKVNTEIAVITVGKNNKYHHPHSETMDKLKNKNIEVHRTDECGNIIYTSTGNGLKTDCKQGSYNYGK